MSCANCQNRIEAKLKNTAGIEGAEVNYNTGTATVAYNASLITFNDIKAAIVQLGYTVQDSTVKTRISQIIGTLLILLALYILLEMFSTSSLAASFPIAREGMGYGMMLIIGLITSVHCIAMCGGINLSQTLVRAKDQEIGGTRELSSKTKLVTNTLRLRTTNPDPQSPFPISHSLLLPSVLYNGGRLISYTAVGVLVGTLGSLITISERFRGTVFLAAGILMLLMGINMLGLFPSLRRFTPRLPNFFTQKINGQKISRWPLIVGFLNGFMPCGPLQAMQLYALSTGSPIRGGVSMFLFCMGTIPLMFALGAVSGILSGAKGQAFSRRVMQVGAVLIAAMGLAMFSNGWNLTGRTSPLDRVTAFLKQGPAQAGEKNFDTVIENGVQLISSTLHPRYYTPIFVQQGIPVRWTINAPPGSITGCNDVMVIREYGIQHAFKPGENIIEFLPTKTGRFAYSCWMGMIRSSITVLAEGESVAEAAAANAAAEAVIAPTPAGVNIPTDEIAVAQIAGDHQTVVMRLGDGGFTPSIVVMQRQIPAHWNIAVDSGNPGSRSLIFPAYYAALETKQGDNSIPIIPIHDFELSTADNTFYAYVKVVDDIKRVDIAAIKAEVAEFQTLIYPPAYFELANSGGCCSRRRS